MRTILAVAVTTVVFATSVSAQSATIYQLFGPEPRASHALSGNGIGVYHWPGSALSASTKHWFGNYRPKLVRAVWTLAWNPQGSPVNGVRIVLFESLPARHRHTIAEVTGRTEMTPVVNITELTAPLKRARVLMIMGQQLRGNPLVFDSRVEVAWR